MAVRRIVPAAIMAGTAALLSGCADLHHGYESVTRPAGTPVAAADGTAADNTAKTVHGQPVRLSQRVEREPYASVATRIAAIPSPQQIFDFHPRGSQEWRSPVIIPPNEGPLTADVRRTAAELRESLAERKAGQTKVAKISCGEAEVEARKPGCLAEPKGAHASASSTEQDKSGIR